MLKPFALYFLLASTPVCVALAVPAPQEPAPSPTMGAESQSLADLARLRGELQQARQEVQAARAELDECLDLLEQNVTRPQRRDCAPSRSLLTYYQWMDERGHADRAQRMLDQIVEANGTKPAQLNSVAWELMTGKATAGKFDRVALALARRMLESERKSHRYLDTAALAFFLNGDIDQAVNLQRSALAQEQDSGEYRRRLRTYEAAQRRAPSGAPTLAASVDQIAKGD